VSYEHVKNTLEVELNTNFTTYPINWSNTTIYALNGNPVDISGYDYYIKPEMEPNTEDRGEISTDEGIRYEGFMRVNIFGRIGKGTNIHYAIAKALNAQFKENVFDGVVIDYTRTGGNTLEVSDWAVLTLRLHFYYYGA